MNEIALNISNLSFKYPSQLNGCLDNINLSVKSGEKFGLFGPNGAGKSTLINLLTGVLSCKNGSIEIFGEPKVNKSKSQNAVLGFVPQDFSFYNELSPKENLFFYGALYGLNKKQINTRTTELLDILGLMDVINKPVGQFSGGMKRRVNLAIGVIHQPKILFLDEPTVGVDIQTRHAIISYLLDLNNSGTTLVYTSHQLSEAESLCDKIAMIDDGKIIVHDTLSNLLINHNQNDLEGLFLNLTGKAYRN